MRQLTYLNTNSWRHVPARAILLYNLLCKSDDDLLLAYSPAVSGSGDYIYMTSLLDS